MRDTLLFRHRFLTLVLGLFCLLPAVSSHAAPPKDKEKDEEAEFSLGEEIIPKLMRHCVRVLVWTKMDEGEAPSHEFSSDLENERPTLRGGYMWDKQTVLVQDVVLHERFIRKIEVEAGGKRVEAKIHAYFQRLPALLLRLQAPLAGVDPMAFVDAPERKNLGKLRTIGYSYLGEGRWGMGIAGAVQGFTQTDEGSIFLWGRSSGMLVRPDGGIVGAAFASRMSVAGAEYPWRGADLKTEPLLTAEDKKAKIRALQKRLSQAAMRVRFALRTQVEEDDTMDWRSNGEEELSELFATGFAIGPRRVLVPASIQREIVARIEGISLRFDGEGQGNKVRRATFVGALKDWHAILLDVEGEPLAGALDFSQNAEFRHGEIFLKANVNYKLRRRKERLAFDRFRGFFRTYRDLQGVWTYTNEEDGSVAVSLDGKILALAAAQRMNRAGQTPDYGYINTNSNAMFRPAQLLQAELSKPEAIDRTNRPVEKVHEKRIVTLGVEWQGLTVDLAKTFQATKDTRGGEVGLLVLYVYPGSPAQKAGLKPEDILLCIKDPDRTEPIELRSGYSPNGGGYMYKDFGGGFDSGWGQMPSPWPARRNMLTMVLTEIGEDRDVKVEYLRKGKKHAFSFTTGKSQVDYESARKYKTKALGFTAKELTYEVRRFFKFEHREAVVVAKVKPGAKAAVAGMAPHRLLTHINGEAVRDFDDFKARVEALQKKDGAALEFTLEYMGKTRLVKIEL